jgi:hypothetical protein
MLALIRCSKCLALSLSLFLSLSVHAEFLFKLSAVPIAHFLFLAYLGFNLRNLFNRRFTTLMIKKTRAQDTRFLFLLF